MNYTVERSYYREWAELKRRMKEFATDFANEYEFEVTCSSGHWDRIYFYEIIEEEKIIGVIRRKTVIKTKRGRQLFALTTGDAIVLYVKVADHEEIGRDFMQFLSKELFKGLSIKKPFTLIQDYSFW